MSRIFVGDFETTVYENQTTTEVWASALVELFTEKVFIHKSIATTIQYLSILPENCIIYYHNLKFDGSFIISYLLLDLGLKQAYEEYSTTPLSGEFIPDKKMQNNTFKYSISDRGQWYTITIKINNKLLIFRDSLKLLPFSLSRIGKSFKTKHQKLQMEYEGFRYSGCTITEEEEEYIRNDVLVIKEALEIMYQEGHDSLTIGSCCLKEFKHFYGREDYNLLFPNLYEQDLDSSVYGSPTIGDYIHNSYKGGWCYLVPQKANKVYTNGSTADVNSLYPSMMHSESGNKYPTGLPKFWQGNFIPDKAIGETMFFFVRIKTRFYLKENSLPFIQIKNSFLYKGTEALETSDMLNRVDNKYYTHYYDKDGNLVPTTVTLTLTMMDYYLLIKHYELVDFEILDGCYFWALCGLFDMYINKYKKVKLESKGAKRELAKLFLNNLYGKMASSMDSSYKIVYLKEDGSLAFRTVMARDKIPGYIAIGSAITSYARCFTINTAQANYYGKEKDGFIYADTDSIHCNLPYEQLKNLTIHDKNFCCWKIEGLWDKAIFTRQKTYIEHITHEDLEPIEPFYSIKCAGMPDKSKKLFEKSLKGEPPTDKNTQEEKDFINTKRELTDFKVGLQVPSKLMPKRIRGGTLLVNTTYKMH